MDNPKKCIENARNRVLRNKLKGVVCDFISKIDNLVGNFVSEHNSRFPMFPYFGNRGNRGNRELCLRISN